MTFGSAIWPMGFSRPFATAPTDGEWLKTPGWNWIVYALQELETNRYRVISAGVAGSVEDAEKVVRAIIGDKSAALVGCPLDQEVLGR